MAEAVLPLPALQYMLYAAASHCCVPLAALQQYLQHVPLDSSHVRCTQSTRMQLSRCLN